MKTTYFYELVRAMEFLGAQERVLFLGQAVAVPGTAMTTTLVNVPKNKLREMPVAEEMQLGIANGLALDGWIPVCIYPRWNFLLLAFNQLINHLDKIYEISNFQYRPNVIIRTSIGSVEPLHPQAQHVGDFTNSVRLMCTNVEIIRLEKATQIFPAYERAYNRQDGRSTVIVEYGDYYNK